MCFVPGSLIYKLDIGNRLYTIRFEHGHSADLFSDYNLLTTNSTERPLAYFLSRVLYSSEDQGLVDTREVSLFSFYYYIGIGNKRYFYLKICDLHI